MLTWEMPDYGCFKNGGSIEVPQTALGFETSDLLAVATLRTFRTPGTERIDLFIREGHGKRSAATVGAADRLQPFQERIPVDRVLASGTLALDRQIDRHCWDFHASKHDRLQR